MSPPEVSDGGEDSSEVSLRPDPVLMCADMNAGYGDSQVVSNFSLFCDDSEIVALIGPNGCGKSTLLKRLAGILPDSGGRLEVCGADARSLSPREVGSLGLQYVPQVRDVFPSLTVEENLFVGYTDRSKFSETLALFPMLGRLLKRRAGRLSGGERKAVAVARAFMHPKLAVLLLDEPSAGLSPKATADLWPVVRAAASTGVAIVIVEQRVDEVLSFADRAYVMVGGVRRDVASASELRQRRGELARLFVEA